MDLGSAELHLTVWCFGCKRKKDRKAWIRCLKWGEMLIEWGRAGGWGDARNRSVNRQQTLSGRAWAAGGTRCHKLWKPSPSFWGQSLVFLSLFRSAPPDDDLCKCWLLWSDSSTCFNHVCAKIRRHREEGGVWEQQGGCLLSEVADNYPWLNTALTHHIFNL